MVILLLLGVGIGFPHPASAGFFGWFGAGIEGVFKALLFGIFSLLFIFNVVQCMSLYLLIVIDFVVIVLLHFSLFIF